MRPTIKRKMKKAGTSERRSWLSQSRSHQLLRVKERLERDGYPRFQMALIVALTGGVGFCATVVMLKAGLHSMVLRYPLALVLAYLFFLFLIWLWLRTTASDWTDGLAAPDLPNGCSSSEGEAVSFQSGEGGNFGGGGSSGSFDLPSSGSSSGGGSGSLDAVDFEVPGDDLAIPLIAIAAVIGLALASLYVVYLAPVLLAEVLVDGAISYALYRHLRHQERRHWLRGVVRHTAWPFVATAVFLAGMGWGMAVYAPEAKSIGEVVAHRKLAH